MTQHSSKSQESVEELSLDVSEATDPARSRERSKALLKSPHTAVGIAGSTQEGTSSRNWSLAKLQLGGIQGDYTKRFAMETEFTQHITTSIIRRKIDKGQTRTKKNDTTTRLLRTRRHNRMKTRRTKPGLILDLTDTVSLLETHNIRDHRKGRQPLQETGTLLRIPNTVGV